jgi:squalene-hopene/tetraprenyl-beta-curcumene cyclase
MGTAFTDLQLNTKEVLSAAEDLPQVEKAIRAAQGYLLSIQHQSGYWSGTLEADASVTAGYIPLMFFMHGQVDSDRQRKAVNQVLRRQNSDGSWSTNPGAPGDLNVSIQVYFALKLAGIQETEPAMQQARGFILSKGGISRANVFTKIWLALFGQYAWRGVPSIPPEIIFLPNWFFFNIYEFASWSRETIMALCLVLAAKPVCQLPETAQLSELYVEPAGQRDYSLDRADRLFNWKSFFRMLDSLFKTWEKLPFHPLRKRALHKVEAWVVEHQETDGSWGGIMLPWIYCLMALKSMGYGLDHPVIARGLAGLESFIVEDEDTMLMEPSVSPIWDTAWAMIALRESGLPPDHPRLQAAASWLLEQEIRKNGDWKVKNPHTEPGGWAFEFANDWYPDLDDSAVVPRALLSVQLPEVAVQEKAQAIARSLHWILDMQSKDGGWAAFDRDNDKQFLNQTPFADFMSPLDPTCADVTAHVIELLASTSQGQAALERARAYLHATQESDGAWFGRWGVNYIYGTGLTVAGLIASGEDPASPCIRRAIEWLASHQNSDGGWGETCETYQDASRRGTGPSTPSQTAWALIGLLAAGEGGNLAAQNGIGFLLKEQHPDGGWFEDFFTGTGFPRLFYLRYDLYRVYFPLIALARYQAGMSKTGR